MMEQSLFLGRIENPIQLQSCLGKKTVHPDLKGCTGREKASLVEGMFNFLKSGRAIFRNCSYQYLDS